MWALGVVLVQSYWSQCTPSRSLCLTGYVPVVRTDPDSHPSPEIWVPDRGSSVSGRTLPEPVVVRDRFVKVRILI